MLIGEGESEAESHRVGQQDSLENICDDETGQSALIRSMHSSRMRTARLLPVSPSMQRGVSAPGGCLLLGGVCYGGVSQHALRQTPPTVNRMTDRQV